MGLAIKHNTTANGRLLLSARALQKSKVSPSSLNQVSLFFSLFLFCRLYFSFVLSCDGLTSL